MVELEILSGKRAGTRFSAGQFPVRIGRAPNSHLCLQADGVWDNHIQINFDPQQGFLMTTQAGALAAVNGQPTSTAILRNGDSITVGAAHLRFWLGQTRQPGLRIREFAVWAVLAAVTLSQILLLFRWLP